MDQRLPLYEQDFYLWTQAEAAKLRRAGEMRLNIDMDFENLAEEVEGMGRSELFAYESELARVVEHLLKLEFSPAPMPRRGWRSSVKLHRVEARRHLADSPSLRSRVRLDRVYAAASSYADRSFVEHEEQAAELPPTCPYILDQILDDSFFPVNRHGLTD